MAKHVIAAFDFGKNMGWCRLFDTRFELGTEYLYRVGKHVAKDNPKFRDISTGEVYLWSWGAIERTLTGATVACWEDVQFNRGRSYIPGQSAILMALCEARQMPYCGVGVSELKRWAAGHGQAPKERMLDVAEAFAMGYDGPKPKNSHEADALLVAMWAREHVTIGGNDG